MNTDYTIEIMKKLGNTFLGLFNKNGWLIKGISAVVLFFQGIHLYLGCIAVLTMIDVLSGVYAAMKRGEKISSREFRKGLLEKTLLYMMMLISVFFLDIILKSVVHFDTFYLSGFITFLIATYELSSIMENIQSIRPDIKFISVLPGLFKKMQDKTVAKLEDKMDDIGDAITNVKSKVEKKD